MSPQIPLDLSARTDFSDDSFIRAPCNRDAYALVTSPKNWPNNALALIGESGAGKTHLGHVFAQKFDALVLTPDIDITQSAQCAQWKGRTIWLDDAAGADELLLFTLINMAISGDVRGVLLSDTNPPANWPVTVPDLRSRLGALTVCRLNAIDDELLTAVIKKLFKDKGLKVHDNVASYLVTYANRSIDNLTRLIDKIDHASAVERVNVTRSFVAKFMQNDLI